MCIAVSIINYSKEADTPLIIISYPELLTDPTELMSSVGGKVLILKNHLFGRCACEFRRNRASKLRV